MNPNSANPVIPKNIRHDLDPVLVKAQIDKKVASHQQNRDYNIARLNELIAQGIYGKPDGHYPPTTTGDLAAECVSQVTRELQFYSTVRVIELGRFACTDARFVLVYGDVDDATVYSGTGPFKSVEKCAEWFFNGGR